MNSEGERGGRKRHKTSVADNEEEDVELKTEKSSHGFKNIGKRFQRPVETPASAYLPRRFKRPESISQVSIKSPGFVPVNAVVNTNELTRNFVKQLENQFKNLPRLEIHRGKGAIDIQLNSTDGTHIKTGIVMLQGLEGNFGIKVDPTTRRFRKDNLTPGEYLIKAASTEGGRGSQRVIVRDRDVTRCLLQLDGSTPLVETATVKMLLKGTNGSSVKVRAIDKATGRVVFNDYVSVDSGLINIENMPAGRLHFDIEDDDTKTCYDKDVDSELIAVLPPEEVSLNPSPSPPPPDWKFETLGREFFGLKKILSDLDINSIEELARVEPEELMHKAETLSNSDSGQTPIHPRLFACAVESARKHIGIEFVTGENNTVVHIAEGKSFARSFLLATPGEAEFIIDIGPSKEGELIIKTSTNTEERRTIIGYDSVKVVVTNEDVASRKPVHISLKNSSEGEVVGIIRAKLPEVLSDIPHTIQSTKSNKELIENIYKSLADQNPGLNTTVSDFALAPENIQALIDRAKAFMDMAGVCSMNDLGHFRYTMSCIIHPGIYIAPAIQPINFSSIGALENYAFEEVLGNNIIRYRPNDILHDTAIVLAGEWDMSGQFIVIGHEVRELVVIAKSIHYDASSQITWEFPILPPPNSYWPNPAPRGADELGETGNDGHPGYPGEQDPGKSKNGGADALTSAPVISLYVLDTTDNLPHINLGGQAAGNGGNGQDGGAGGNGAIGYHAIGWAFEGCERSVGWGGDGGKGGRGGRGGKGGDGGNGGKVMLFTSIESIKALEIAPPWINVAQGIGGSGGPPGSPGQGGLGGPAGSDDCEPWCDEHPERRGKDGPKGDEGQFGVNGKYGKTLVNAIQIFPITEEEWYQEFNKPHILSLNKYEAELEEVVKIYGQHFDKSIDHIYFDGSLVEGTIISIKEASFTLPKDIGGGYHPVRVGSDDKNRLSNKAMLKVIPRLDEIPQDNRWKENEIKRLKGLAFRSGLKVLAEDRSVNPVASYELPVKASTQKWIDVQIPDGSLGDLRGVRRIVVENDDGGKSRAEHVIRISETVVVRCAAFRVIGDNVHTGPYGPPYGTSRSVAEIENLFSEGASYSISVPWGVAKIVFKLVQPVASINWGSGYIWPHPNIDEDKAIFNNAQSPGRIGCLNFYFVRDVEEATAFAYCGGPIFIGDEGEEILSPIDFQQLVAHEVGHALCLRHICDGCGCESPGTYFDRECEDGDESYLMYPYWDTSDGMNIPAEQIEVARRTATRFEEGKTSFPLPLFYFSGFAAPQCKSGDPEN